MRANEPSLVKTPLLEAGNGGYAAYRIPGIVVTTAGTLLAYGEARKSAKGDWGAWPRENLTVRLSYYEGQTWPIAKVLERGISGSPPPLLSRFSSRFCDGRLLHFAW